MSKQLVSKEIVKSFWDNFANKSKPIFQYIRKGAKPQDGDRKEIAEEKQRRRKSVGVILAYKDGNKIRYGWSKCTLKRSGKQVDAFDKQFGLYVAAKRAIENPLTKKNLNAKKVVKSEDGTKRKVDIVPHVVKEAFIEMQERAKRYFNKKK